jgi:hypothetical protein
LRTWFSLSAAAAISFLPIASRSWRTLREQLDCLGLHFDGQRVVAVQDDLGHARIIEATQDSQKGAL